MSRAWHTIENVEHVKKGKKSFVSKQRYGLMLSINLTMIWVSHCDL